MLNSIEIFMIHIVEKNENSDFITNLNTYLVEKFTRVFVLKKTNESIVFIIEVIAIAVSSIRINLTRCICVTWSVCKSAFVFASFTTFAGVWPLTDSITMVVLKTFWAATDILSA